MKNKKIIFLGPLYPEETDLTIKKLQRVKNSVAPNVFQWNLLDGLSHWCNNSLEIVNALPVGTWPRAYEKLCLHDEEWISHGIAGHEMGCVNLPVIKQYIRYLKTKKYLKKHAKPGTEILIYSAYMPFLKAAYSLPPSVKVTAIITDLPEYYDLEQVSWFRRFSRWCLNRMIYRYLKRVDRFVLLTDQMAERLQVGERPWMRMEGICSMCSSELTETVESQSKAILYSGTLHYQYGILNLLSAFAAMDDPELELWICGSGEAEKEILSLAESDQRIKFFGFCSTAEVAKLRSQAAILVNPRTNEGEYTKYSFPSKTMEYMTSGKPVVMYRLDGIPEEYDSYLFYADPDDHEIEGLKNAISWVLEHKDEAMERAKRAREFVITQKNAEAQSRRILSFLEASNSVLPKVLFITNIPSPYRIDFFNLFGRQCDLTVAFERKNATNRDVRWEKYEAKHFKEIYASVKPWRHEQSKGNGLVKLIRENHYDIIIFSGYGSPSVRRAIAYCRCKKIPYYIEYDGAFNKKDPGHKYIAKKYLVKEAKGHFITCQELEDYLTRLGVSKERLLKYPFSSLNESDILSLPLSPEEKKSLKAELGIHSSCAILSVGQFIPRKGFDILMKAMAAMKHDCAVYIVGGKPPLKYEQLKEKLGLDNLHFVNFLSKEELKRWYRACDIFVLPTREDIWGLVVNEAMANGLPVIATDRCIAALELIEAGKNGYVVPVEDEIALAEKLDILVENPQLRTRMGGANLEKIRAYTIENMAEAHISHLKRIEKL